MKTFHLMSLLAAKPKYLLTPIHVISYNNWVLLYGFMSQINKNVRHTETSQGYSELHGEGDYSIWENETLAEQEIKRVNLE